MQQQAGQLLAQQPHWAATAAAAAAHPALHLAIRQTLHEWLAASGNPAVWRLLLLYMQAARGTHQQGVQQQQQHGAQRMLQQGQGQLPRQLRLLYPAVLAGVTEMLLMERPSEAGLQRAVDELHAYMCGSPPPATAAAAAAVAGMRPAPAEQLQPSASERPQQVWHLLLDAPPWMLFCLQRLPLQRLLELAAAAEEAGFDGSTQPGEAAADGGAAQAAAAEYAALLLWPGEPRRRQAVVEALLLQLGDVDLPAMRPWLEMMQAWQRLLQAAVAGGGAAAC